MSLRVAAVALLLFAAPAALVAYKVEVLDQSLAPQAARRGAHPRELDRPESVLDRVSLGTLPAHTQATLRMLLLIPLGALLVAAFRNLVGVPTFGTFMPILLSLAFRETSLFWGIGLVAAIVSLGWAGRQLIERARLLLVPRLGFVLTWVVALIAILALVIDRLGLGENLLSIALFPIVIITMTIERFSISLAEEGPASTVKMVLGTCLVSSAGYFAMASDLLQRLFFTFPELLLAVMGALLLIGRYAGYRLSELWRFRTLAGGAS